MTAYVTKSIVHPSTCVFLCGIRILGNLPYKAIVVNIKGFPTRNIAFVRSCPTIFAVIYTCKRIVGGFYVVISAIFYLYSVGGIVYCRFCFI